MSTGLGLLGDNSLPSALAAPASLRPHRPRPLDPGDLLSWLGRDGGTCLGAGRWELGWGWGWSQDWGLNKDWLELGGAWLGHGWDGRDLIEIGLGVDSPRLWLG